ncbi:MAG: hypothetical protein A2428_16380 [Bdellovibrionales bacterium RIFOXYC1_FULL_54_43]|nr:MAG: hypothetical protein A2428_16380 [Bdellovibrionales bacterium RIFOXYC1_FULL_54_43]OFZ83956.1 MAG: hypothetical protein A2603_10415 [Bdellovibrionales bacterium RIFOXYD1_FULL_55_31]
MSNHEPEKNSGDDIDLIDFLALIVRRWKLLVLVTVVLGSVLAGALIFREAKTPGGLRSCSHNYFLVENAHDPFGAFLKDRIRAVGQLEKAYEAVLSNVLSDFGPAIRPDQLQVRTSPSALLIDVSCASGSELQSGFRGLEELLLPLKKIRIHSLASLQEKEAELRARVSLIIAKNNPPVPALLEAVTRYSVAQVMGTLRPVLGASPSTAGQQLLQELSDFNEFMIVRAILVEKIANWTRFQPDLVIDKDDTFVYAAAKYPVKFSGITPEQLKATDFNGTLSGGAYTLGLSAGELLKKLFFSFVLSGFISFFVVLGVDYFKTNKQRLMQQISRS